MFLDNGWKDMNKLIRNGQHMRPMFAVVKRGGIGLEDGFDRGIWISKSDLPVLLDYFKKNGHAYGSDYWCIGTNQHNTVFYSDFVKLWI